MGRMAEARKRAQKKAAPEPEAAPPEAPAGPLEPRESEETDAGWVARAEAFVFPPDDPEPPVRPGKITLPPSGLAADILAAVEATPLERASRFSLPASGLAEDILAMAGDVPEQPAPQSEGPAPQAEPGQAEVRAHNISFFAAPAREERKTAEATEHLATFFLAGEEYGVDVRLVQEIIRVTDITQVPRAPDFIKGVINLRGRIIPVVDLRRKLLLGAVDESARQARIVVVKLRERLIGLLVDGASQVLKVLVSSVEPPPEEVVESDANYIRGVAKLEKRLIILVDLQKILSLELKAGTSASERSA